MKASLGVLALALGASSAALGIVVLVRGLVRRDEHSLELGRRFVFGVLIAAVLAAAVMESQRGGGDEARVQVHTGWWGCQSAPDRRALPSASKTSWLTRLSPPA